MKEILKTLIQLRDGCVHAPAEIMLLQEQDKYDRAWWQTLITNLNLIRQELSTPESLKKEILEFFAVYTGGKSFPTITVLDIERADAMIGRVIELLGSV